MKNITVTITDKTYADGRKRPAENATSNIRGCRIFLKTAQKLYSRQPAKSNQQVESQKSHNSNCIVAVRRLGKAVQWWAVRDSNPGPPACEAGALTS
jgi:hypothetical protein